MDSNFIVTFLGSSKNIVRPSSPDAFPGHQPVFCLQSNLVPAEWIAAGGAEELSLAQPESHVSDATAPASLRFYTEDDYQSAIEILREMMVGEERLSDADEAILCLSLFEKQSLSTTSVAGFFELLRDIDPNRTRTYRRHIIKEFMMYFPDKPIAKLVTEAFSREWKDSQRDTQGNMSVQTRKSDSEPESFQKLCVFNRTFYKWNSFFRSLRRKREGSVDTNKFRKLSKLKDAYYAHAFIYLMEGGETAEHDYKAELGNIFMQFKNEFHPLLELPHKENASDQMLEEGGHYLQCVLFALMMNEVLIHYVNILKLEGPSAQSLCPDKKKFIIGHLKRFQKTLFESNMSENPFLLRIMDMDFSTSAFRECTYNRHEVTVKYVDFFMEKRCVFHFHGKTDNISSLKCTRE